MTHFSTSLDLRWRRRRISIGPMTTRVRGATRARAHRQRSGAHYHNRDRMRVRVRIATRYWQRTNRNPVRGHITCPREVGPCASEAGTERGCARVILNVGVKTAIRAVTSTVLLFPSLGMTIRSKGRWERCREPARDIRRVGTTCSRLGNIRRGVECVQRVLQGLLAAQEGLGDGGYIRAVGRDVRTRR